MGMRRKKNKEGLERRWEIIGQGEEGSEQERNIRNVIRKEWMKRQIGTWK